MEHLWVFNGALPDGSSCFWKLSKCPLREETKFLYHTMALHLPVCSAVCDGNIGFSPLSLWVVVDSLTGCILDIVLSIFTDAMMRAFILH